MKGNEYVIIGILIIILIICIVVRRIKKQNQEQFRQLINRQIMESGGQNENLEGKTDLESPILETNENVLKSENQQINENEPNDILAYQSTAKLLQENENTKAHESFLFLDTPFKHSFNYIIITIQKLILKVFKTKSGYLITDKNVDNVYVPYENELKPIPFNPYTPIHKIPKYVYVNVVQSAPDLLCIRKGHCYYDRNLKAWKHFNKKRDKKYVKDMIEDLGRKIKHLENKAFNSVGATSARNTVPNNNPASSFIIQKTNSNSLSEDVQVPNININNKINLSKLPTIDEDESNIKLNKVAIMEDAPVKDMNNYLNKNYNSSELSSENVNKQTETILNNKIQDSVISNIEAQQGLNNEQPENKNIGATSARNNDIKDETEDIKKQLEEQQKQIKELQEQQQVKEEQIKEEPEPKPEDLLPKDETKETFWSRFGF